MRARGFQDLLSLLLSTVATLRMNVHGRMNPSQIPLSDNTPTPLSGDNSVKLCPTRTYLVPIKSPEPGECITYNDGQNGV